MRQHATNYTGMVSFNSDQQGDNFISHEMVMYLRLRDSITCLMSELETISGTQTLMYLTPNPGSWPHCHPHDDPQRRDQKQQQQ